MLIQTLELQSWKQENVYKKVPNEEQKTILGPFHANSTKFL